MSSRSGSIARLPEPAYRLLQVSRWQSSFSERPVVKQKCSCDIRLMRNAIWLTMMVFAPLMTLLVYVHFLRGTGEQRELYDLVAMLMAAASGSVGAYLVGRRPTASRIIGVLAYLALMLFVTPIIALFSVCTTGDCL